MKEAFITKSFKSKSWNIINAANAIIKQYESQGFTLTLRQLYYQFVARDLFEDKYTWTGSRYVKDYVNGTINAQPNYDNLGAIISDAREAGLIDWDGIEDRTRFLQGHRTYKNPADAIEDIARRYRIDMWSNQETRIEAWIEKDALAGVIQPVCNTWDINFFACKGYVSQSELYAAGKRIESRYQLHGQQTIMLHLGDHDPSGMDMTRDNEERLSRFAGFEVEVRRIALNMDQVQLYDPPPNPAKLTDCRATKYIEEYGNESWELDALEPSVIAKLIEEQVYEIFDADRWNERVAQFEMDQEALQVSVGYAKAISR